MMLRGLISPPFSKPLPDGGVFSLSKRGFHFPMLKSWFFILLYKQLNSDAALCVNGSRLCLL